jgi:transcriptional regulator with XRE-family HTH domain
MKDQPPEDKAFLRHFMSAHRLRVAEVAEYAGVSARTISRLRHGDFHDHQGAPRAATLQRIADGIEALTHVDSTEIFVGLMRSAGRADEVRQVDLGVRGSAELARHYLRMSPLARHLLLEWARLLATEMPDE